MEKFILTFNRYGNSARNIVMSLATDTVDAFFLVPADVATGATADSIIFETGAADIFAIFAILYLDSNCLTKTLPYILNT